MNYGEVVFQALEPIFGRSCCHSYRSDFEVHDRDTLQRFCVPGLSFLWAVRETGTHILFLDVGEDVQTFDSIARASSNTQLYLVTCKSQGPTIRRVTVELARQRVLQPCSLECKRLPSELHGRRDRLQVLDRGREVATAEISVRYEKCDATPRISLSTNYASGLDAQTQIRIRSVLERQVNRVVGTLFWVYESCIVNGGPASEWLERLTDAHGTPCLPPAAERSPVTVPTDCRA